MLDSKKVAELKRRITHDPDITSGARYFFQEFAKDPEFYEGGVIAGDLEIFEVAIRKMIETALKRQPIPCGVKAYIFEEHHFLHGLIEADGMLGTVVYFGDEGVGFISLITDFATGRAELIRIQGVMVTGAGSELG